MEQQQQQEPPPRSNAVKLPPFWVCNPAAWFATAEGAFELRGIVGDRAKFFNVLTALPETTISLIADLVEAFQALKDPTPGGSPAHRHTEGGAAACFAAIGGSAALGAVSGDDPIVSQGGREQLFFQLFVLDQAA